MHGLLRTALGIAAGATAMVMLEPRARPRRVVSVMRRVAFGKRIHDRSLADEVASKLEKLTPRADAIQVSAENGCVMLAGDVLTEERAELVQGVASVPGVDSVVDLMTERAGGDGIPLVLRTEVAHEPRAPVFGAMQLGAGVALLVAGGHVRGAPGIALGASGALLTVLGLATAARPATRLLRPRVHAEASAIMEASPNDVFAVVRALDNAPRWLRHARGVERRGAQTTTWTLDGKGGHPVSWTCEITSLVDGRRVAWRSVNGSRVEARGEIEITPLGPMRSRVTICLSYVFPIDGDGRAMRRSLGDDPARALAEDLERLRALVQEVPRGTSLATR